jgi:S-DNA-T family DNA segregation ATPase FtsK/SpoIIIE
MYGSGALLIGLSLVALALLVWRWRHPDSFSKFAAVPARSWWRHWHYRFRWEATMTGAGLAVSYQSRSRVLVPELRTVIAGRAIDRVVVHLCSGQGPSDVARAAEGLAHGFGASSCRVRSAQPGFVILELVRKDMLATVLPAMPIPHSAEEVDLGAVPVGVREDGSPWTLQLRGNHVQVAGATGAGKNSVGWSVLRALVPAIREGIVQVLAADPKRMELALGRDLFAWYAAEPEEIAVMLEDAVAGMHARAAKLAGHRRDHIPSKEHPFILVVLDEVAFLTAYQPDRKLRDRTMAALATLTTQGRAVGYCTFVLLQDPRKEVLNIRNLFPTKVAMRLDEAAQVDLVLGDGARDRGALADMISTDPATGAGVGYVRLENDPDPVRVRAFWVSDDEIREMSGACSKAQQLAGGPLALGGVQ